MYRPILVIKIAFPKYLVLPVVQRFQNHLPMLQTIFICFKIFEIERGVNFTLLKSSAPIRYRQLVSHSWRQKVKPFFIQKYSLEFSLLNLATEGTWVALERAKIQ